MDYATKYVSQFTKYFFVIAGVLIFSHLSAQASLIQDIDLGINEAPFDELLRIEFPSDAGSCGSLGPLDSSEDVETAFVDCVEQLGLNLFSSPFVYVSWNIDPDTWLLDANLLTIPSNITLGFDIMDGTGVGCFAFPDTVSPPTYSAPFCADASETVVVTATPVHIPEPATLGLFAIGLAGLGVMTHRRRRIINNVT